MKPILTFVFLLIFHFLFAQADTLSEENKTASLLWSTHFQFTAVSQSHSSFKALYSGTNSLNNGVERGLLTITSTAFIGRKLWRYTDVYANPEISGGQGASGTRGIAGFTNGESFRVGNPQPNLYMARYYIRQYIALSNKQYDTLEEGANGLREIVPSSRLALTAGKFCLSDFFDNNAYSHDPRTQFLNWSLMSNGAWDYPANTRGYTIGLVAELITPASAVRASLVQVPIVANGPWLNKNIGAVNGATLEYEKDFTVGSKQIKLRALGFRNLVNAPSYNQTVAEMKEGDSSALGVFNGTEYNNKYHSVKYGAGINGEIKLSDNVGCFLRASYNDGKTATWAYTEIDKTMRAAVFRLREAHGSGTMMWLALPVLLTVFQKTTRRF